MAPLACQKRLAPAKKSCQPLESHCRPVVRNACRNAYETKIWYAMLSIDHRCSEEGPFPLRSHRSSGFRDDGLFSSSQRLTRERQTYGGKDEKGDGKRRGALTRPGAFHLQGDLDRFCALQPRPIFPQPAPTSLRRPDIYLSPHFHLPGERVNAPGPQAGADPPGGLGHGGPD